MEYEGYVMELWDLGYRDQPPPEVAKAGARVVTEGAACPYCGGPMRYEGFVDPQGRVGSRYVALAVCRECNYCEEF